MAAPRGNIYLIIEFPWGKFVYKASLKQYDEPFCHINNDSTWISEMFYFRLCFQLIYVFCLRNFHYSNEIWPFIVGFMFHEKYSRISAFLYLRYGRVFVVSFCSSAITWRKIQNWIWISNCSYLTECKRREIFVRKSTSLLAYENLINTFLCTRYTGCPEIPFVCFKRWL